MTLHFAVTMRKTRNTRNTKAEVMCKKPCPKRSGKRYYNTHKEHYRQYYQRNKHTIKQRHLATKDHIKQYSTEYYQHRKDIIKQKNLANKDHIKHYSTEYYQHRKDIIKQRYLANKDHIKQHSTEYYQHRKDIIKQKNLANKVHIKQHSTDYYQHRKDIIKQRYLANKDHIKQRYSASKETIQERYLKNRNEHLSYQKNYQTVRQFKRKHATETYDKQSQAKRFRSASNYNEKTLTAKLVTRYRNLCRTHQSRKEQRYIQALMAQLLKEQPPSNDVQPDHAPENIAVKQSDALTPLQAKLEATRLLQGAEKIKRQLTSRGEKAFALLQQRCRKLLADSTAATTVDSQLNSLLGVSQHTKDTELYFSDSAYRMPVTSSIYTEPLIVDAAGLVTNVFSDYTVKKVKTGNDFKTTLVWKCGTPCKDVNTPSELLRQCTITLRAIVGLHGFSGAAAKLDECSAEAPLPWAQGHPLPCHSGYCSSHLLQLRKVGAHFPQVRQLEQRVYKVLGPYKDLCSLTEACEHGDAQTLSRLLEKYAEQPTELTSQVQLAAVPAESTLLATFGKDFEKFHRDCIQLPRDVCDSCDKQCFTKNLHVTSRMRKQITCTAWMNLRDHVERHENRTVHHVCDTCLRHFRAGKMPPCCKLNGLVVQETPPEISQLNDFEKYMIQQAKAFQVVYRKGTVGSSRRPYSEQIKAVKGRTFHLPLPISETLRRLTQPSQFLNQHDLHVIVRSIPTSKNTIWEELVDVGKILRAVETLKVVNHLYKDVSLPTSTDQLKACLNGSSHIHLSVADDPSTMERNHENEIPHDSADTFPYSQVQALEDMARPGESSIRRVNPSAQSRIYEQYTINPLHSVKPNDDPVELYQMLRIDEDNLDPRYERLEELCFPDLFPFGMGDEHQPRDVSLTDAEYAKVQLLS